MIITDSRWAISFLVSGIWYAKVERMLSDGCDDEDDTGDHGEGGDVADSCLVQLKPTCLSPGTNLLTRSQTGLDDRGRLY